MTRFITIITCFITALFLFPAHGEDSDICEYEQETEVVCCAAVSASVSATSCGTHHGNVSDYHRINVQNCVRRTPTCFESPIKPSVRTLFCVFRE